MLFKENVTKFEELRLLRKLLIFYMADTMMKTEIRRNPAYMKRSCCTFCWCSSSLCVIYTSSSQETFFPTDWLA